MTSAWWRALRFASRAIVRAYYRSFRVEGADRIPREGPVLLVVNHPNALLDPAAVMLAVPRPVAFGARAPLFSMPVLGGILRRLGAIPIYRPKDAKGEVRRNLDVFAKFAEHLRAGGAAAIFPEGVTHLDPELKEVKSGPARIALEAEASAGWTLGLRVVPVGLQFEPKQKFRGDVTVRVGEPFGVADLRGANRHEAIRAVQGRIAAALRPLIVHLDRTELEPLVQRVAEMVEEHRRASGGARPARSRAEVVRIAGAALNHFLVADPAAVEEVRRRLRRYDRMSGRTGITAGVLRAREKPFRAALGAVGNGLRLVLGFPFFLAGALGLYVPYVLTEGAARSWSRRAGEAALPLVRILCGAAFLGGTVAALSWLTWRWSGSLQVTAVFAAGLVACGLYARVYARRCTAWRDALVGLLPPVLSGRTVRRVAAARDDLLALVNDLAARYAGEAGAALLPPGEVKALRRYAWRGAAVVGAGVAAWFLSGLGGRDVEELEIPPSPWAAMDAGEAALRTERDAAGLDSILTTMERLHDDVDALRADFASGKRSHYAPKDNEAVRRALLTYLTCRSGLFRTAWYYREPRPGDAALDAKGFVLAYGSAVELAGRGMQFVEAFGPDAEAVRRLNEAEPTWEVPPGTYDRIRGHLANPEVLDLLSAAGARFERLRAAGLLPAGDPWTRLAARASEGGKVAAALAERLWSYRWRHATTRALGTADEGRYAVSSVVSTWIGDARVRQRPHGAGLVSRDQLERFRAKLRPGDILVERRNWYLSNVFLPGFWPHAALYLGGVEGVRSLGIEADPRVAPHLAALAAPDHEGHPRVVTEAISDGVLFTSLEESIGGADAVCAFRPRIPREKVAEAVARGIRHHSKPYDFDFDFFSTDRLVCTELVYQSYEGILHFDLVEIMGRRTLPALEFVKKWDRERGRPDAELELVAFLDADEAAGVAREAGEEALRDSISRPGTTLFQPRTSVPLYLHPAVLAGAAMVGVALAVRRRR